MKIETRHIGVLVGAAAAVVLAFRAGEYRAGQQFRAATNVLTGGAANTFTKCLTEGWEASGELEQSILDKRRWVLK